MRSEQQISIQLGSPFERAVADGKVEPSAKPRVLFADSEIIVAFKPPRVHTVPTAEGDVGTLQHQLEVHCNNKRRLHVVHRLDMPTSGILVFAKTGYAHAALAQLFSQHDLVRRYDAFVSGSWPESEVRLTHPVKGKAASTRIRVVTRYAHVTRLEATLDTGRTHQIRIHAQRTGHPVLGDRQHGHKTAFDPPRLALHARVLEFKHPRNGKPMSFDEPLAPDLAEWCATLEPGP